MKKLNMLGVWVAIMMVVGFVTQGQAALGDRFAVQDISGTDIVRISSTGHVIPGTDNTPDLGITNLEWRNLNVDGTANIDALSVDSVTPTLMVFGSSATLSVTSTTARSGSGHATNSPLTPPALYWIWDTTGTTAQQITQTSFISTTAVASYSFLIVQATGTGTITLQDNSQLAGSGFELSRASVTLNSGGIIGLILDNDTGSGGKRWREVFLQNY